MFSVYRIWGDYKEWIARYAAKKFRPLCLARQLSVQNLSCIFIYLPCVLRYLVILLIDLVILCKIQKASVTFPPLWRCFSLSFTKNIFMAIVQMNSVPCYLEFKRTTWLAFRSQHFTIEIDRCSRIWYNNSSFSCTSHLWNYLLIFASTVFDMLNTTSITIFFHLGPWSFIALSPHKWFLIFSEYL